MLGNDVIHPLSVHPSSLHCVPSLCDTWRVTSLSLVWTRLEPAWVRPWGGGRLSLGRGSVRLPKQEVVGFPKVG